MCIQGTCIPDMCTPATCTRDTCTRATRIRDTSGGMHILAGTDIDPTGVVDDMLDPTGVRRGRRAEDHMAAGMVGGATGADS